MLACLTLDSVQQEKVEDVLQHLREKSVRITETRRAVLSYLVKSQEHPSADAIYQDLKPAFPNMSLATVYNNLKVLIEEGFVSEIKVRNDTTTYFDFMGHDHLNLICESCGKIDDIDTVCAMYGHPAATGNKADNLIPRHRAAALGKPDRKVMDTFYDNAAFRFAALDRNHSRFVVVTDGIKNRCIGHFAFQLLCALLDHLVDDLPLF